MVSMNTGALHDITVLDLSRVLAAPYCGQILGDLGADVIKVERPGSGDDGRRYGTNALPDAQGQRSMDTSFHLSANRNKTSITLELATERGQDILLRLLEGADVLIENFKAGTMKRFGLDYESLRSRFPRLVYCSLTGYGQTGPYAARPGYDPIFQAQSGLMFVTGQPEDEAGSEPLKVGPSIVDVMAGMNAAIAVLAALRHRDATGQGQYIDIALLDSAIAATAHSGMEYLISGRTVPRNGNQGNGGAPANSFRCLDGRIYFTCGTEAHFQAMCETLDLNWLRDDPRFATAPMRFALRQEINQIIETITARRTVEDLVSALSSAGVPAGAVNDFEGVFADPQVRHRGVRIDMPHPVQGSISLIGSPLQMSETPPSYRRPPPQLGEHTDMILADRLGLTELEIQALRENRYI